KTLFNIKETRLLHIAIPSINAEEIESYRRPQNQGVFRTLQVLIRSFKQPAQGPHGYSHEFP
ncbi:hypothetical protein, partial [Komagataeibacter xylinus]|uniref:hypothetical protein n=1 Tax=Komagataeibacter xylinus TaxID=28448 RepID=UPI0039EC9762